VVAILNMILRALAEQEQKEPQLNQLKRKLKGEEIVTVVHSL
jgi:hypothetical protein